MRARALLSVAAAVVSLVCACGSGDDAAISSGDDASTHDGGGSDATSDSPSDGGANRDGGGDAAKDGGGGDGSSTDGAGDDASASDASDGSPSQDAADSSSPCGVCAQGFTCGGGGYCVSSTGVPQFDHLYVIVMENHSLSEIQGSSSAPYINALMNQYAYATQYTTADHPSLPNYIEMTSGDTQGIACDCAPGSSNSCNSFNCNLFINNCDCPVSPSTHLGDQLDGAGIQWREYAESMGSACSSTGQAHFAAKHVPFLYYTNVYGNSSRCAQRVRDYGDFATDLTSGTYRLSYVSPNLCSDMHDTCNSNPIQQGDDWLKAQVPGILARQGFQAGGRDALVVVWDENDTLSTPQLPLIVVSPLVKQGSTATAYTHYSLLATIEDGFGLGRIGKAAQATPVNDIWK